jgi:hypothetical protein
MLITYNDTPKWQLQATEDANTIKHPLIVISHKRTINS